MSRPNIVFLGNAQASALCASWCANVPGANAYNNHAVHHWFISEVDRKIIASADIVVLQISDMDTNGVEVTARNAKFIRFPYVNGAFLWPYCGHAHPDWGTSLMHEYAAFNGESGDGFLTQLLRRQISASEAVECYALLDIVKVAKIPRRYELALDMQRLRDQRAEIGSSVADYIERNLSREILFISRQRLAKPLFWHLAGQIFDRLLAALGDRPEKTAEAEQLCHISFSGHHEMPIHQKIVRYFDLPGRNSDYKYRINCNRLTFNEYTADYMNGIFQTDIYAGIRLLRRKEYAAAVAKLKLGAAAAPSLPDAAAALGEALAGLGRDTEALEVACVAVHRDGENCDILIELAARYLSSGFASAAEAALKRALELYPCHLAGNQMLCNLLVHNGRSSEAINLATELANKLAHVSLVHWRLGHLLLQHDDIDGAERSFRTAVSADRQDYGLLTQYADVLMRLGRADEAITLLRVSVTEAPNDAGRNARLGHILWRDERFVEAEQCLRAAVLHAPEANAEEYKILLAGLLSSRGCTNESVSLLQALIERNSENALLNAHLAHSLWRHGDLDAAASAFERAIFLDPEDRSFAVFLSHVLAQNGKIDGAVSAMRSVIAHDDNNLRNQVHLGDLFLRLGDCFSAETAFEQALTIDRTDAKAMAGLDEIRRRRT